MSEQHVETTGRRLPARGAALAAALALPVVFGVAAPASAAPVVSHDGCTVTPQTPKEMSHTGDKVTVRFTVKATCDGGSDLSFRQKVFDEDAGPDHLIHSHRVNHEFAGPFATTFNYDLDLTLGPQDNDQTSEFYHTVYFRVDGKTPLSPTATSPTLVVVH